MFIQLQAIYKPAGVEIMNILISIIVLPNVGLIQENFSGSDDSVIYLQHTG